MATNQDETCPLRANSFLSLSSLMCQIDYMGGDGRFTLCIIILTIYIVNYYLIIIYDMKFYINKIFCGRSLWYQQKGLVGGASVFRPPERGTVEHGAENVRNLDVASGIDKFIFSWETAASIQKLSPVDPRVGIN